MSKTTETTLCVICMFSPRAHEIVVRRGIFPAHDFAEREAGR